MNPDLTTPVPVGTPEGAPLSAPTHPWQKELQLLNQRGNFLASVLTDGDGLPLAVAAPGERQLAEMLAAVAPLIERMVQRSNERAGLPSASEVAVQNADGSRLVCRFFSGRGQTLILACLMPDSVTYRRVMNLAVRAIQKEGSE